VRRPSVLHRTADVATPTALPLALLACDTARQR
jgi:hypothetical protein